MIHSYDYFYCDIICSKVGNMFELAYYNKHISLDDFANILSLSKEGKAIEKGDEIISLGKSSNEILGLILNEPPKSFKQNSFGSVEYWSGYVFSYAQWYFNISFENLLKMISLKQIQNMYFPFHELDILQAMDKIKEYIHRPNIIKEYRERYNISQSELAIMSQVPIRNIRAYEQGKVELCKASGETLLNLSRALSCHIEDLLK